VNLTALFIACLHKTGLAPHHIASIPLCLTSLKGIAPLERTCLLVPFRVASSTTLVFNASPGVTSRTDSTISALNPATTVTNGLLPQPTRQVVCYVAVARCLLRADTIEMLWLVSIC